MSRQAEQGDRPDGQTPLRILMLEDVPRDADLEIRELRRAGIVFETRIVAGRDDMIRELDDFAPDIILSDFSMPQFTGMDALEIRNERAPHLPFVVVTASISDKTAVDCIRRGADDYVTKEHLVSLQYAISNALQKKRLERVEREARQALAQSETRLRLIWEHVEAGVMLVASDTREILDVNEAASRMIGAPREALVGRPCHDVACPMKCGCCPVLDLGQRVDRSERTLVRADGTRLSILKSITPFRLDDRDVLLESFVDITERRQAEMRQALHARMLASLNRGGELQDLLSDLLREIKRFTGFDAVGIRLKEEDDFPYFVTSGFSEEFVEHERSLCAYDESGKVIRDYTGNPCLDCICGTVIEGRTDAAFPFFTDNGSFWTNSTTKLREETCGTERLGQRIRNRCNDEGHESTALVPLRSGTETVGLLQLNDSRPDRLTPKLVRFFEQIGNSIGIAFKRARAQQELRESEAKHRALFESSRDAIMTAAPPSWRFASGNPAALAMFDVRSEAELTTRALWEYSPDCQPDGVSSEDKARDMIQTAMQRGSHLFEWTYRRSDGVEFPATVLLTRMRLEDQDLLQATVRDMTEQREMEAQLLQAQKLESIGTLAGGVAHEINNPINGIMGYAELIKDELEGADETLEGYAGEIIHETKRVADLVKNLLQFARQDKAESHSPARVSDILESTL